MQVSESLIEQYYKNGVVIVPNILAPELVVSIRNELELARNQDLITRGDAFDKGMVHNCMFRGAQMAAILDCEIMNAYLTRVFNKNCILYAYQSSSAPPNDSNYGGRIHVDSPRFIPGHVTNVGTIFPLNDFTRENGGTRYIPGSHLTDYIHTEEEFNKKCSTVECKAGDMMLLNARLVHATGFNSTDKIRHAITMNYCQSYMRQRFDFCRMKEADSTFLSSLGVDGKRLLGMNVRMPTSLDEFYLPEEERLYKPGQG